MEPDAVEIRVVGCLVEKQRTTPDAYPLSLNALRLACNQSTNRDPVVAYDEATVSEALRRLALRGWTRLASGAGSRARKYRHLLPEALGVDDEELALLAVLMLRGPQTPGELKQRSERLHALRRPGGGAGGAGAAGRARAASSATRGARARRRTATSRCSAGPARRSRTRRREPAVSLPGCRRRRRIASTGSSASCRSCGPRSRSLREALGEASRRARRTAIRRPPGIATTTWVFSRPRWRSSARPPALSGTR